jgi:hypothetical protein
MRSVKKSCVGCRVSLHSHPECPCTDGGDLPPSKVLVVLPDLSYLILPDEELMAGHSIYPLNIVKNRSRSLALSI